MGIVGTHPAVFVRVATAGLKVALFSVGCEERVSVADKRVSAAGKREERHEREFERKLQGREELTELERRNTKEYST